MQGDDRKFIPQCGNHIQFGQVVGEEFLSLFKEPILTKFLVQKQFQNIQILDSTSALLLYSRYSKALSTYNTYTLLLSEKLLLKEGHLDSSVANLLFDTYPYPVSYTHLTLPTIYSV